MIIEYHRPESMAEALHYLTHPNTFPLGGGTLLNQKRGNFSVVDLQALKLNTSRKAGSILSLGSMVTLQSLCNTESIPLALKRATSLELPLNLRNVATIGGALMACSGKSPLLGALMAMDAVIILNTEENIPIGDFLMVREEEIRGKIITKIYVRIDMHLAYEQISRTATDKPINYACLAYWSSSRIRLVIGGWGKYPSLALDGKTNTNDMEQAVTYAAMNAAQDAADEWASQEYRSAMAPILAKRCLDYCIQMKAASARTNP